MKTNLTVLNDKLPQIKFISALVLPIWGRVEALAVFNLGSWAFLYQYQRLAFGIKSCVCTVIKSWCTFLKYAGAMCQNNCYRRTLNIVRVWIQPIFNDQPDVRKEMTTPKLGRAQMPWITYSWAWVAQPQLWLLAVIIIASYYALFFKELEPYLLKKSWNGWKSPFQIILKYSKAQK